MMVTSKRPISPSEQHQNGFMFHNSMMRTEHLQNTMDRKVYLLDGYGILHTIAKTAITVTASTVIGLSITTATYHDMVSDTVQIEDRPHLRSPDDVREQTRVSGGGRGSSLALSQSVVFTLSELSAHDVIHDKCSNYYVSLSREALESISKSRVNPSPKKTVSKETDNCTLSLNMVIVDNRREAPSSYFINSLGRVFEVPVTNDPSIEDGIWIQSNLPQSGPEVAEWQSLTDSIYDSERKVVPPVTLFTNALEAKRFGDESAASKEREHLNVQELARLKHDLEIAKQENASRKEELSRLAASRTDYYDERSSRRKDDNEKVGTVAKAITGVVAVAGALVGLIRWFT